MYKQIISCRKDQQWFLSTLYFELYANIFTEKCHEFDSQR